MFYAGGTVAITGQSTVKGTTYSAGNVTLDGDNSNLGDIYSGGTVQINKRSPRRTSARPAA
jgi:hypothetical protein